MTETQAMRLRIAIKTCTNSNLRLGTDLATEAIPNCSRARKALRKKLGQAINDNQILLDMLHILDGGQP